MVGTARELELKVTELLQSHDEDDAFSFMDEELLLLDEQRKLFPKMEYIPGKYAVKII